MYYGTYNFGIQVSISILGSTTLTLAQTLLPSNQDVFIIVCRIIMPPWYLEVNLI
jgi:hypothetical protein